MSPAPPNPLPAPPEDSVSLPAFPLPARIVAVLKNQVGASRRVCFWQSPLRRSSTALGGSLEMITALKATGLLPGAQRILSHPADTSTLAPGHG